MSNTNNQILAVGGGGGAFWFGEYGFLYKRKGGGGGRRSTKMTPGGNTTCNSPTYIYNKYKPGGGGVGASSIANRRAKNRLATICGSQNNNCFPCFNTLGQYSNYTHNPNGYVPCPSISNSSSPTPTPTPTPTAPSAPTLDSLTPGNGELTLTFTLGSDGGSPITDIEYSTDNGSTWSSSGQTTSPVTATGLTNGTSYDVAVRAVNATGPSPSSNVLSGIPVTIPSAPTLDSLTPANGQLTLIFTLGSDGGSSITDIEYSTDNGSTWTSSGQTTSPIVVTGLTNGISYDVAVRAINAFGTSPSSNVLSGTPAIIPTIESFTSVGTTSWTAPTGVTSVEYLVVGGGGGSGATHDGGAAGGGGGGMVLTGTKSVIPGTTYTVIVGNGGAGGIGLPSPSVRETNGLPGNDSSFDDIIGLGGGGGLLSRAVGNGAGGASASNPTIASIGIASIGGNGGSFSNGGGGGGGSNGNGADGVQGAPRTGGSGGAGTSSNLSGVSLTYGTGGIGGDALVVDNAAPGAVNTGNGAKAPGTPFASQRNGAQGGSGIVIIKF